MTYDSLKFLTQNSANLHVALIDEFLDTATEEEYAKIPIFLFTQEERDFVHRMGTVMHPSREYIPDESPLVSVYSVGGMPFKIKIKTDE